MLSYLYLLSKEEIQMNINEKPTESIEDLESHKAEIEIWETEGGLILSDESLPTRPAPSK